MKWKATACLIVLLAACSKTVVTDDDNGKTIVVDAGHKVEIKLSENPSTGYSWAIEPQPVGATEFEWKEGKYIPDKKNKNMVGVGGKKMFEVRLPNPGKLKIEGCYFRPWEKCDMQKDKTFRLLIEAR